MNKLKAHITFFLLLTTTGYVFGQSQRDSYIVAARVLREQASITKCPERARVLEEYARWNDCMVKVLAGQSTGCGPAPTTPIPTCEADGTKAGSTPSTSRSTGTVQPQSGTINEEAIRTTVEGIGELLALTKRSPEKIEAARKKRNERITDQMDRENALYGKRSFALTLDYSVEEQKIKNMNTSRYIVAEKDVYGRNYDVGKSYSAAANIEFRLMSGSRAGFFHTGLGYLSYANPVFLNRRTEFAKLQMNYLNIPAFVSFRLFEYAQGDFISLYPQIGFTGGYLIKASTNPSAAGASKSVVTTEDVSNDFNKFSANALLGFRMNIWRVYIQSHFSYPLMTNLLKEDDNFTKAHRGSISNITVGLYIFK